MRGMIKSNSANELEAAQTFKTDDVVDGSVILAKGFVDL